MIHLKLDCLSLFVEIGKIDCVFFFNILNSDHPNQTTFRAILHPSIHLSSRNECTFTSTSFMCVYISPTTYWISSYYFCCIHISVGSGLRFANAKLFDIANINNCECRCACVWVDKHTLKICIKLLLSFCFRYIHSVSTIVPIGLCRFCVYLCCLYEWKTTIECSRLFLLFFVYSNWNQLNHCWVFCMYAVAWRQWTDTFAKTTNAYAKNHFLFLFLLRCTHQLAPNVMKLFALAKH